jgi:Tol biopolymer transport system component
MGEVYLARDTRLARDVAIKVLPSHLADTPEARARFEREARAVSSLNHPHICTLYDVGREGGIDFLVMERIEGETLAKRLARGPLPVDQTLRLGGQIADALDRAHRGGLVHRDLKPGNVMIAKSGAKLMDFGLARTVEPVASGSSASMASTLALEAEPVTAKGTIVGTFQYLAPEQLEGREADARTDLWALGCVLYEMATGKRAFQGSSQASLISSIMSSEPRPMSQLVPLTPPALDRLVRACLAKDPQERIQSAHDVKLQLQWIADGDAGHASASTPRSGRTMAIMAAVALALVALSSLGTLAFLRPKTDREVQRFLVGIPPGQVSLGTPRMSPDGRTLAFFSRDSAGKAPLFLRPMDALEARPIPGTEIAGGAPCWSPDGRSLAFVTDHKLCRIPVTGGAVVKIADAPGNHWEPTWSSSGVILLDGSRGDSMIAYSVNGGAPRPASRIDRARGDMGHFSPRFLPDGQHFVFVSYRTVGGVESGVIMLGRLGSLEAKELGPCLSDVDFAPPDQVLYMSGTTLVAHTLDIGRGVLTGNPVPLAEGLDPTANYLYSTGGGVLALVNQTGNMSELVWADRMGNRLSRLGEPDRYRQIELSPDGGRIALSIADPATALEDIWVRDLDRGVSTRLTFGPTQDTSPVWSADGMRLFYSTNKYSDGSYVMYSIPASGGGDEDSFVVDRGGEEGPSSVSPDGKWVAVQSSKGTAMNDWDILIRDTAGKEPPRRFCTSNNVEFSPEFSPDGRWIAYASDETGREEVYVRRFPDGLDKVRVSNNGGSFPGWRKDGREMYYVDLVNDLVAVPILPGPEFRPGKPVTLFHTYLTKVGWPGRRWAVTADGQRFLLNESLKNPLRGITVTRNWQSAIANRP